MIADKLAEMREGLPRQETHEEKLRFAFNAWREIGDVHYMLYLLIQALLNIKCKSR